MLYELLMLTLTTQIFHEEEVSLLASLGLKEAILEPKTLARRGKLSLEETQHLIQICQNHQIEVSLQWDILSEVQQLPALFHFFQQLPLTQIQSVRVQDPGVAYWLSTQPFSPALHLICENGNHNLFALQQWEKIFPKILKRLILSTEIPGTLLEEWIPQLQVDTELLGLGPILLFYSPRKLLSPHFGEAEELQQWARSPESNNRDFLTLENTHGSFLYHTKDLCLLDFISELARYGLKWLRLDRYEQIEHEFVAHLLALLKNTETILLQQVKNTWKKSLTAGFFRVNRTDASFGRLKISHLDAQNNPPCAEVIEVQRKKHLLLLLFEPFKKGESFFFITPEKRKKSLLLYSLKNSSGQEVDFLDKGSIAILPWASHVPAKTFVWRDIIQNEVL